MQDVTYDQRLEDVKFKVTVHASYSHCNVIAHDLSADHSHSLTLSRIHLSRHYTRTWFVFRQKEFSQSTSGSTAKEPDVIGNLVKTDSNCVQGSVKLNEGILGGQRFKLILGWNKPVTCLGRDFLSNPFGESKVSVQSCSDSCTSLGDFLDVRSWFLYSFDGLFNLMSISRELLT